MSGVFRIRGLFFHSKFPSIKVVLGSQKKLSITEKRFVFDIIKASSCQSKNRIKIFTQLADYYLETRIKLIAAPPPGASFKVNLSELSTILFSILYTVGFLSQCASSASS